MTTRAATGSGPAPSADALDAADPLRAHRARFTGTESELVYLDGNSLGRLPRHTPERLEAVLTEWGERLIGGWEQGWMELPLTLGDRLARAVLGAGEGQVAVADSTTVCLYKLAAAAITARPGRREIVTERGNFPTDRYVLESLAAQHDLVIRWLDTPPDAGPTPEDVAALTGPETALVALSHVDYRSAHIADMAAISAVAHAAGALTLWDLSHSAGAVEVALDGDGADLACGCTYKYLNAGPGAPAWLYVRAEHQTGLRQPLWGWLGRRDPFAMAPGYEPAEGITAMLSGTPPVLALTAVEAALEMIEAAGIAALRAKSVALTEFVIACHDAWLAPLGVTLRSPRDSARRGGHVALGHPEAQALSAALVTRGVITDFRHPDIIRVGLSPLTTSFAEAQRGMAVLRELLTR